MPSNRYLFAILFFCPYLSTAQIKKDISIPHILTIHNIKCRSKSRFCTKEQDYPRVIYVENSLAERKMNSAILTAFDIKGRREPPTEDDCKADDAIRYRITTFTKNTLSIIMLNYFFGNGAGHSYYNTTVLNFDIRTGNKMLPESILLKDSLSSLKNLLIHKAKIQLDSLKRGDMIDDVSDGINNWIYSIDKNGFVFYGHTSDGGLQEIEVPVSHHEINRFLKKDFYKP